MTLRRLLRVSALLAALSASLLGGASTAEAQGSALGAPSRERIAPRPPVRAEPAEESGTSSETVPETAAETVPETAVETATAPTDGTTTETVPEPTDDDAPLELDVATEPVPRAPGSGAQGLPSPGRTSAQSVRQLANLSIEDLALDRDRGSMDADFAVGVTLYIGGVLLSIASAALIVGAVFEAACVNGLVDECLDGPAFVAAAIPATLIAATVLVGASMVQRRADAWRRQLDERGRELDERRHRLERDVGLAIGPGSLHLRLSF